MRIIILLLVVYGCTNKPKLKKQTNSNVIAYLEIEKNNFLRDFLLGSEEEVYIIEELITEVKIEKVNNRFKYVSSLEISEIDKIHVYDFVQRITPFLMRNQINKLEFSLSLPVKNDSSPKPPARPPVFYGNFDGGKMPQYKSNPYN